MRSCFNSKQILTNSTLKKKKSAHEKNDELYYTLHSVSICLHILFCIVSAELTAKYAEL